MYRIFFAISLIVFNSCASAANNNSVKSSAESKMISDTNIIEIKSEEAPFDIWERIRLELSITIPDDQIAATSLYRERLYSCLLYTSPSPRDGLLSRMPSSA